MPYRKTLSKLRPTGRACRTDGCDGMEVESTITRGAVGQVVQLDYCEECLARRREEFGFKYGRAPYKPAWKLQYEAYLVHCAEWRAERGITRSPRGWRRPSLD